MNILFLNDNSAHVNWGAQASPPALLEIIEQSLPEASITALPHVWLTYSWQRRLKPILGSRLILEKKRWRPFRSIVNRCSSREEFYPEVADDFDRFADEWLHGQAGPIANEFLAIAKNSDMVVYNGENSLYRNTPEGCHGMFLLWLAKKYLNKPSCIVNHTAHQTGIRPIMDGMMQLVFPELDVVAVRESSSLRNLQALGIDNAVLFPDVVFSMQPANYSQERVSQWRQKHNLQDQSYFCLSASGLPVSKPRGEYDGEVTQLVRSLKALGLQAVLLAKDPWCLFLAEVAKRTDSLFFGPEHEFHDLWPVLEGAAFLVSGHYHYVIFGAMVGCPFIPLSVNNHKMQGLCTLLEWHRKQPFDATFLRSCRSKIMEEAERVVAHRDDLNMHLLQKKEQLHEETWKLGTRLASVWKGTQMLKT